MLLDLPADNCRVLADDWPRPDVGVTSAFQRFPVANIGDAMDRFGLMSPVIVAQWPGARCAGPAFPILTREGDNLAIHRSLPLVRPGDVLVINGLGADTRALFGDLLAEACLAGGVAGVVIDGAVRDADAIGELGLPLWAKARTPAGPTKNGPGAIGGTISCGGLVVAPGDLVIGDGDGVAVVPRDLVRPTLDRLAEIEEFEAGRRAHIRSTATGQ
jgi:regulator of RNase E activity RraA